MFSPGYAAGGWSGDPSDNVPVCTAANDQSDPALVADGTGGVIVAWIDHRGGVHYHIYAQHLLADGTLDPNWPVGDLAVSTATNDQSLPAIASDGAGGALIAWSAIPDGAPSGYDVYAQHVLASGAVDPSWPALGRVVCSAGGNQAGPTIVADGAGGAVVTWMDYRNSSSYPEVYAQHVLATGAIDTTWPTDGRALGTGEISRYSLVTIADDAGGVIATWYELHFGSNYDIVAQRVLASGTVDPAWPVNGLAVCAAAEPQVNPKLVADGAGGAIIVWADERGGIGANDIYAQHVLAGGAVDVAWPADGLALCTAANSQADVVLVNDGAGGALVAWEDMRAGVGANVYAQHLLAGGTVDPSWPADGAALCGAAGNQTDPAIVADGTGGATVAWIDGRENCIPDLYAQHVRSDGTREPAWPADGLTVSTAPMSKYQPTIVGDGARGAIVVWDGRRGSSGYDVFAQVVRANGWLGDTAPPVSRDDAPVCTAAEYQFTPSIVADGAGGGIITWQDGRNAIDYDVYAQRVLANGEVDPTWPVDGRALCAAADLQLKPVIATDGVGGAIVAWTDHRGGVDYDVYVQHVLVSGTTDPTWPTDGRALCAATGDQMECAIVADGAGGAIVTWQDFRNGVDQDIYAQHIRVDGSVDPNWPPDGRALCTAAENQFAPTVGADGSGGAIVSWFDYRGGTSDIYAQRVHSNGTVDPAWPADGLALCTAANHQVYPAIIADGTGGAIVTWNDGRITTNSYNDVYAQHVLASGAVDSAWPVDGRALCTAGTKQGFPPPVIVADGLGGAFVAWADSRHGPSSYADIYAQHVGADGALDAAWPDNGRGVCTEGNEQNTPAIVGDGAGGAIVTWVDQRAGCNTDVYAQHVLAGNAQDPAWPIDGRAVTRAKGYQYSPVATADGAGGVIVAWEDDRGGAYDIYSQHLMGDGVTAAFVSLVSVEADVQHVLVTWFTPQSGAVSVYRHEQQTGWLAVASAHPNGSGLITYLDRAVEAGKRYGYRVGLSGPTGEQYLGETWVTVTASASFGFEDLRPNPANRNVAVSFSLSSDIPATVELIDLAGRIVATHRLAVKQGRQVINLREGSALPAGIYLVRLRQGDRSAFRKLCLVH